MTDTTQTAEYAHYGIRPHVYRPEDDELRKRAAEIPFVEARCRQSDPHAPHDWVASGALVIQRCPGREG